MPINIPNLLTLFRIVSILPIIYLHKNGESTASLILLAIGLLTDFFDGHLARRLHQETHFGAIFDPIADKMVAIGFYSYLAYESLIPWWFGTIILLRNFSQILSLPILVWWLKKTFFVRPSFFAKMATAASDAFIFLPLYLTIKAEVMLPIMILIALAESAILLTYIPRLYQIATDQHDTFT